MLVSTIFNTEIGQKYGKGDFRELKPKCSQEIKPPDPSRNVFLVLETGHYLSQICPCGMTISGVKGEGGEN